MTVELYFLYNTLTISKPFKDYMSECAALGWLGWIRIFLNASPRLLAPYLKEVALCYETLEGIESLAMEHNCALLEAYLVTSWI